MVRAKANRKQTFSFSRWVYRQRNLVERLGGVAVLGCLLSREATIPDSLVMACAGVDRSRGNYAVLTMTIESTMKPNLASPH